jgi:hypothetical protein
MWGKLFLYTIGKEGGCGNWKWQKNKRNIEKTQTIETASVR